MKLEKIVSIITNKPPAFVFAGLIYLVVVALLKWFVAPNLNAVLFVLGGILGIYFLDIAEAFIRISPSPFRSIVFAMLFAVAAFFVVSSSTGILARGLVLTIHLMLLMLQIGEWQHRGNLNSWYEMVADVIPPKTQLLLLWLFGFVLFVNTLLFIR